MNKDFSTFGLRNEDGSMSISSRSVTPGTHFSSGSGGGKARIPVKRGGGVFVNRTSRNARARRALQSRTGKGAGGRFTTRQLREAVANGTGAGRKRTL